MIHDPSKRMLYKRRAGFVAGLLVRESMEF